jgi:hypothetical protein
MSAQRAYPACKLCDLRLTPPQVISHAAKFVAMHGEPFYHTLRERHKNAPMSSPFRCRQPSPALLSMSGQLNLFIEY